MVNAEIDLKEAVIGLYGYGILHSCTGSTYRRSLPQGRARHPADYDTWPDSTDIMIPLLPLQPYPSAQMRAHLVSARANSSRGDVPEAIAAVAR